MEDLTGRSRFTHNVFVYWVAQVLVIIVGFIVPRQISDHLGVEALGVWDLGWAAYRYLAVTGIGAVGVNRYIALYRASSDMDSQSRVYTASIQLQGLVSLLLIVATMILTMAAVHLDVSGFDTTEVRMVVLLFCLSVLMKLLGDPSRGVLTGAHRWDLHHTINASQDLSLATALVVALNFDADLVDLGIIVLVFSSLTTVVLIVVKNRICPEIKFRLLPWEKNNVVKLVTFGAKSLSNSSAQLILFQTVAITIGVAGGPASLAIYSRSQTLVRISDSMIQKIANILMPIASSLVGLRRQEEARALLLDSCTLFMCASIPIGVSLFFFGDIVVHLWMGDEYVNRTLMAILAIGCVLPIGNAGTYSILAGLNAHGTVGLAGLIVTVVGLLIFIPIVHLHFQMTYLSGAAIVAILWIMSKGMVIPVFLKLRFGITLASYIVNALLKPAIFYLPLTVLFWFAREALLMQAYLLAVASILLALLLTPPMLWFGLLPTSIKELVASRYNQRLR